MAPHSIEVDADMLERGMRLGRVHPAPPQGSAGVVVSPALLYLLPAHHPCTVGPLTFTPCAAWALPGTPSTWHSPTHLFCSGSAESQSPRDNSRRGSIGGLHLRGHKKSSEETNIHYLGWCEDACTPRDWAELAASHLRLQGDKGAFWGGRNRHCFFFNFIYSQTGFCTWRYMGKQVCNHLWVLPSFVQSLVTNANALLMRGT